MDPTRRPRRWTCWTVIPTLCDESKSLLCNHSNSLHGCPNFPGGLFLPVPETKIALCDDGRDKWANETSMWGRPMVVFHIETGVYSETDASLCPTGCDRVISLVSLRWPFRSLNVSETIPIRKAASNPPGAATTVAVAADPVAILACDPSCCMQDP